MCKEPERVRWSKDEGRTDCSFELVRKKEECRVRMLSRDAHGDVRVLGYTGGRACVG